MNLNLIKCVVRLNDSSHITVALAYILFSNN